MNLTERDEVVVEPAPPPRLAADAMLGSLARWLRVLGLDVAYDPGLGAAGLVELAVAEERTILTRDTRLVLRRRAQRHLLIRSSTLPEQLLQVCRELAIRLEPAQLLRRCLRCNNWLEELDRQTAREHVPPYVFQTQNRFTRCPRCARVYWRATHAHHMLERLRQLGLVGPGQG